MNIPFCDLCKKQIVEKHWATVSFPRVIDGDTVVEFYKESDVCGKCMIALTRTTKVTMHERQPIQTVSEKVDEPKPE
jgi:hypothetical protein